MAVPMLDHIDGQDIDNLDFVVETVEHVAQMLVTGSRFFTLGMRAFYLSIPFVFWYFGPWALLTATIVTLLFMYLGDVSLGAEKIQTRHLVNQKAQSKHSSQININGPSSSSIPIADRREPTVEDIVLKSL